MARGTRYRPPKSFSENEGGYKTLRSRVNETIPWGGRSATQAEVDATRNLLARTPVDRSEEAENRAAVRANRARFGETPPENESRRRVNETTRGNR